MAAGEKVAGAIEVPPEPASVCFQWFTSLHEQLADHLTADAGVARALHLHQREDAVLVQEEVVHRPAVDRLLGVRHPELAAHQQPAARLAVVDLVAGEEVGVVGEERLEEVLRVVGRLLHRA